MKYVFLSTIISFSVFAESFLLPSPTPYIYHREEGFLENLPKNAIVVELGVQRGCFSEAIIKKTNPSKLYLIDCWENQDPNEYDDIANVSIEDQQKNHLTVMRKFKNYQNVEILKSFSIPASFLFDDNSIDWIYIDANHSYEAVKEDIKHWWPKIKKGGFLTGHDYVIWPGFGVVNALNEFLIENNLSLYMLTTKDSFNSWAVQK